MATCTIFEEDEVSAKTEKGYRCGLVIESSEYISSDEEDDKENVIGERVKKGTVRVAWHPDGEEEILPESKVALMDRSLMPGDVVRRMIAGQESQRGYVMHTSVKCHLQIIGKNRVICGVDSRKLKPLKEWDTEPGDVYFDSWVGKIESVQETITLRFPDGAKCTVDNDDDMANSNLWSFEDPLENRESDTEFCMNVFYPGQNLTGSLGNLSSAVWIKPSRQYNSESVKKGEYRDVKVIVDAVEPRSISVHWLCRGFGKSDLQPSGLEAPHKTLVKDDIKRLKKIDCFEASSTQIGDKAFYTITDDVTIYNVNPKNNRSLLNYILHDDKASQCQLSNDAMEQDLNSRNTAKSSAAEAAGPDVIETVTDSQGAVFGDAASNPVVVTTCSDYQENGPVVSERLSDVGGGDWMTSENVKISSAVTSDKSTSEPLICGDVRLGVLTSAPATSDDLLKSEEIMTSDDWVNLSSEDDDADDEGDSGGEEVLPEETSSAVQTKTAVNTSKKKKHEGKHSGGPAVSTRQLKKRKLKRAKKRLGSLDVHPSRPGDVVVVEVLCTSSTAQVMWQDGSVEKDIHSTELYPIHHLDELEFFPGDFVLPASSPDAAQDDVYGVVEQVDHVGRTCIVRWMTPASSLSSSLRPSVKIEAEEVSAYDIKDHPDYKFRPGHIVIRVAGYEDGDENGELPAAGQVYELGQEGDLVVAWAGGGTSQCFPQEFYLMGDELSDLNDSEFDPDSDEELTSSDVSDSGSSWETEKEEELEGSSAISASSSSSRSSDSSDDEDSPGVEAQVKITELLQKVSSHLTEMKGMLAVQASASIINLFHHTLSVYRMCRSYDKMLSTSHFKQEALQDVMSAVRSALRAEKTHKVAKQVLSMINSNSEKAASVSQSSDAASDTLSPVQPTTTCVSLNHDIDSSSANHDLNPLSVISDLDPTTADKKSENLSSPQPEKMARKAEKTAVTSSEVSPVKVTKDTFCVMSASDAEETQRFTNAKELCVKAFRLLDEQLTIIQENLVKKYSRSQNKKSNIKDKEGDNEEISCSRGDITEPASAAVGDVEPATSVAAADPHTPVKASCDTDAQLLSPNKDAQSPTEVTPSKSSAELRKKMNIGLPLLRPANDNGSDEDEDKDFVLATPLTPQTPADIRAKLEYNHFGFEMRQATPSSHKFFSSEFKPTDSKAFLKALMKELKLLKSSLPRGIYVKGFEDRMDLFSVMIEGPALTPYEDGLFFFEVQLSGDHPSSPPSVHYISYCSDRLNPNLYENGKVCVSLLGTWSGRGTEVWSNKSTLLQVLISFQGLILVREPYYNEAGYDKQLGTQQALENSRMYNEMAIVKMVQSMAGIVTRSPCMFEDEVLAHLRLHGCRMLERLESWLEVLPTATGSSAVIVKGATASAAISGNMSLMAKSDQDLPRTDVTSCHPPNSAPSSARPNSISPPQFPLIPLSKGFRLSLQRSLDKFRGSLNSVGLETQSSKA